MSVKSTLLICSGGAAFVALAPRQKLALKSFCSWCALPNSAYFLHFSLLAILNTGLRLFTCMLHSETTARTWGIAWSPQGSAGFTLVDGDFRASGAASQRKPTCMQCDMLPRGKITGPCCVSSRSSRAEQLCHLWGALGGCLGTTAAPLTFRQMGKRDQSTWER